jgi:predicted acetyltransferase
MCMDANWRIVDADVALQIGLGTLATISADGYRYAPRHAFRAQTGVPGVVYAMVREADEEPIGEVTLLLSADEPAVMHVGHMGCAIRPEHRRQGHTTRLIRALAPVLRDRGVGDLILGSDVGHASHYQSILDTGASLMGEDFAAGSVICGARFRLAPPTPASDGAPG